MQYYKIPLSAVELFENRTLLKYNRIEESIADNIRLILTTAFGEYAFDATYGCSLWDGDFENISSDDRWKEKLSISIRKSIEQHEPRLTNVMVNTEIVQDEVKQQISNREINRIKRRVDVTVDARIALTDESFWGRQKLYVSPISLD